MAGYFGYDDYQTEEEYIAASKRRVTMADAKELVAELRGCVAPNWECETGSTEPITQAADALERERDEAREAAAFHEHNWQQERDLKLGIAAELATIRARLRKMEEALKDVMFLAEADHVCLLLWNKTGSGANYAAAMARAEAALTEEQT